MVAHRNQHYCIWIVCLIILVSATRELRADDRGPKPEKITVTILAISTMTWNGFAGDEEIFLASLIDRQGNRQLIRLTDWTPSGIRDISGMAIGHQYRMMATRTPWCDSTSSRFYLPTSAGDRSKFFLPDASGDEASPVPCYFDRHDSIRSVRKVLIADAITPNARSIP